MGLIQNIVHVYVCTMYSRTSPQRPPWGQRKVAIVQRWPLCGGRCVIWQFFFFWGCNIFFKKCLFMHIYCKYIKQKLIRNRDQLHMVQIRFGDLKVVSGILYTLFISRWLTGCCWDVILEVRTNVSGCYRCGDMGHGRFRDVKIRVNMAIVESGF